MAKRSRKTQTGLITFSMFFTEKDITEAIDKARVVALRHQGGFVRKVARQSIKRMGKARAKPKGAKAIARWYEELMAQPASPPGKPPFTHTGFMRENIAYAYDRAAQSVVVGPWMSPWLGQLHEFGGTRRVRLTKHPVRRGQEVKYKTARYPARPFMRPALETAMEKLPSFLKNVITTR